MESHAVLCEVDPTTAAKLHPNDLRKIRRALDVYSKTGVPYSEWVRQQKSQGYVCMRPTSHLCATYEVHAREFPSLFRCARLCLSCPHWTDLKGSLIHPSRRC